MEQPEILIIDLGSQYTTLFCRCFSELGYRSLAISPPKVERMIKAGYKPKAIILSGGSASVSEENAPQVPEIIFKLKVPILGICYGMQWLAYKLGGQITLQRNLKEYGPIQIKLETKLSPSALFDDSLPKEIDAWASHGDSVSILPPNFVKIATSKESSTIAGMANPVAKIWGLQFHP